MYIIIPPYKVHLEAYFTKSVKYVNHVKYELCKQL